MTFQHVVFHSHFVSSETNKLFGRKKTDGFFMRLFIGSFSGSFIRSFPIFPE
eukprot:TRINITY_DN1050_c0_g1_i1.p3 TRINITY_DN1050_c0_g1~~TRINITY_DN1050_c0_g1_i1.p3  ORF type:complete len:52 (+),score=4.12 TRINITY_DN1050_c0_g1_i1:344-499(+)